METIAAPGQAEPGESQLPLAVGLSRLRRTHGYDLAVRLFGSMWFLFLVAFIAHGTFADARAGLAGWPVLMSRGCLAAFFLLMWALIIIRLPALAQSDGLMPTFTAFLGTYMPWSISLFAVPRQSAVLNSLSAGCLILGVLLAIFTLSYLGRSFSLVPQARRVVQAGPYGWIRHPLYLAEEIAVLGTVLQFLSVASVLVFLAHIVIQIRRILYEEELLRRTLPEYGVYEVSRWCLVPHVW